ncbi:hypothetical protein EDB86DRAFT_2967525, partial [Lactarius hatsudake]
WIAGHSGIKGNKEADEEAKKAAEGTSSPVSLLPALLKKGIKTSRSVAKQSLHTKRKTKWKKDWEKSTRFEKTKHIDPTLPLRKFIGLISNKKLSRAMASKIKTTKAPQTHNAHNHKAKPPSRRISAFQNPAKHPTIRQALNRPPQGMKSKWTTKHTWTRRNNNKDKRKHAAHLRASQDPPSSNPTLRHGATHAPINSTLDESQSRSHTSGEVYYCEVAITLGQRQSTEIREEKFCNSAT